MTGRVGKYRLLREIGRGAMGTVYLGHDAFSDRPVAIKIAHRRGFDAPEADALFQSLFYNEMRAAGRLRHPNIVQVFDAGNEGDDWYIVMEYVAAGMTLDAWALRGGAPGPRDVADVALKCAEALDYGHRKGVIHRDIKPGNVLVSDTGAVKLADFSVAVLVDSGVADTQLMVRAGSPLYMSPEQVREDPLTGQSDLFSLGVVMYELLAGRHPFSGSTLAAVTHSILEHRPPPLHELRGDVPEELSGIVARAMAKDCEQRYASAWDLAADLSQVFRELEGPRDGIDLEHRVDLLKSMRFFNAFPDAEVWELLRFADWQEHEPGGVIVEEGAEGDTLYVVVRGEVAVSKRGTRVARLGEGECFGELAWLTRRRRTATVVSEGCTVLALRAEDMERASESCQVQFQKVFINTLAERLTQTTETVSRLV